MNLDSIEDLTLLRNCTIMKLIELKLDSNENELNQESISDFSELLKSLRAGDFEGIQHSLLSAKSENFSDFTKYILETPSKEIKEDFFDLSQEMLAKGLLSHEQSERFSKLFYTNAQPEHSYPASPYRTDSMQNALNSLNSLIKQNNPRTISTSQFRSFAAQYRDLTKFLGMSKFQQYFDKTKQTITDMQISYDLSQYDQTVYKTDFTLRDSNFQENSLTITEPQSSSKFISSYYQNLCYAYLESNKFSTAHDSILDQEVMAREITKFSECYTKLAEMSNCQISHLVDGKVYFSSETTYEPNEFTLEDNNSSLDYKDEPLLY